MRALVVDPALTPPAAASRLRRRRMALPTAMPVEVRDIRTPIPQGPGWVDLPFTRRIREMLLETGRAEPHRAGVNGWVSHPLDEDAIELFRLSYERARVAQAVRESRTE